MNICLFSKEEISHPLPLRDERAQHIIKVLHKKAGDSFTAGVIDGSSGSAVIREISDDGIVFDFTAGGDGKPLTKLEMIIGFPRPIQLKRLLRDIAALGVGRVHLTGTDLGEKSYMQSNLVERGSAYQMLLDGTVQAGSTHVPELCLYKTMDECLEAVTAGEDGTAALAGVLLALDNVNPSARLADAVKQAGSVGAVEGSRVIAAIGSERGWTDRERRLLEDKGFVRCGMGERIMRTETAATVAGAIILSELGII
ncbi:RsmE family RNA methyltransferase [Treponema bryantii]|uniref:RsmE family RNA methyltransferase n=1 Tax=Treponema bryantii TaxID=163 RepID=UPI0003B70533|nr:RsmE family RNA methyltransferase [Treponema bryantii]